MDHLMGQLTRKLARFSRCVYTSIFEMMMQQLLSVCVIRGV